MAPGGEPLRCKDALLLAHAPHLDLDGLNVAAAAASADKVFIYALARVGEGEGGSATLGPGVSHCAGSLRRDRRAGAAW
jgi:hypothetical protein